MGGPADGMASPLFTGEPLMRVLVTGGAGFLGHALLRALVAQGHEVRSFSRGEHPVDVLEECVVRHLMTSLL